MVKPNVYVLGGTQELDLYPEDVDGVFFVPDETRLSVKRPDGEIITVSGGDITVASGYMYYLYKPPTIGWYEYESWVKDGDREIVQTNGFEIIDRVY